ncbi:DNA-directed RNA polymerase subunit B [Candidatus Woesearchaeota archaeon]|nr:DNA-directed RNA polymerase subunit B [Candidatus Woesearchaeota archaeon]
MSEVYIDGKYVGEVNNPKEFVEELRSERRMGKLPLDLGIYLDEDTNNVYINTSNGRALRPLIVVKNGKPLLTDKHIEQLQKGQISWSDLVKQGIIEYVDPAEEENLLVAFTEDQLTEEHTHLEIAPYAMLGITTSLVPFGQHNHGVRMLQGAKNQKQGIGMYAMNYLLRTETDVNILHYPQQPIVRSFMQNSQGLKTHPFGQNLVVAIMAYEGYNIEDAIIVNKGSIERGMGRSTYFSPQTSEELRYPGGLTDKICIPDKDVKGYRSEHAYRLLEEDGIIYPEAEVETGDVVIGKVSPPRFLNSMDEYTLGGMTKRESSTTIKRGECGVVDMVVITESGEGNKLVNVRVRSTRLPEIGDKFTSRHGQKGVIGVILPEEDMPFTANGIRPDIIFSPHSVPSRMTVAHLLELLAGKVGALSGRYINGTIFESEKERDLREELKNLGFREDGTEIMYDPLTGRQYLARIYVGNMYYLRLKHMVRNKMQARARGPVQLLTRQPTEGKAKEGGLRLGEMEKDTFIAHGASLLLKERFDSDKTLIPVCNHCGIIAIYDYRKHTAYCPLCGKTDVEWVETGYAFKLLTDELKTMIIYPKLVLKDKF